MWFISATTEIMPYWSRVRNNPLYNKEKGVKSFIGLNTFYDVFNLILLKI